MRNRPITVGSNALIAPVESPKILRFEQCDTERAWMINQMSFTPALEINKDGTCSCEYVKTSFYLENDIWPSSHFFEMERFADQKHIGGFRPKPAKRPGIRGGKGFTSHNMRFRFDNPGLNFEVKFVFHQMIFSGGWSLNAAVFQMNQAIRKLAIYVNEKYPNVSSIQELSESNIQEDYYVWLEANGYQIRQSNDPRAKKYSVHTPNARIPSILDYHLQRMLADYRAVKHPDTLWNADEWQARHFRQFGVDEVRTGGSRTLDFSGIESRAFRNLCKRYTKEKLLTHAIVWSTAIDKINSFRGFANYIHRAHPSWTGFRGVAREDVLGYVEELAKAAGENAKKKPRHRKEAAFVASKLTALRTLLQDLQMLEYPEAPAENVYRLIRAEETTLKSKINRSEVRFIPDCVVDQMFANFDKLSASIQPAVLTLYYTGLRISDVLELKEDCLITVNGRPMIETDVRKTRVEGHRLPVPDDYAAIMRKHIEQVKGKSNDYTNPDRFVFVNFRGPRRGEPFSIKSVQQALNDLAEKCNITDEDGKIYHFNNHSFRHTYAVRLLNGGASLTTVQDLLAHHSPEMTLAYARLLDETKFREFSKAIGNGAFAFSKGGDEIVYLEDAPADILRSIWANHKYNAIDTPYGTCLQRTNGRCPFASQPPCLTCDNGKPCKNLCVGAVEGDGDKYAILLDSAKKMAQSARSHGREDMATENEALAEKLDEIKKVIDAGGVIYGHADRLGGKDV